MHAAASASMRRKSAVKSSARMPGTKRPPPLTIDEYLDRLEVRYYTLTKKYYIDMDFPRTG